MAVVENLPVAQDAGALIEQVIVKGDLAKLNPQDRTRYYMQVCDSLGLNPLTQPLAYIQLNGKLTLYAKRDCADQLRKMHGVNITIVSQTINEGLITVHVRAKDKTGREDEDMGVVSIGGLKGEAAANAMLKAVTKAKRRVTLSICGLGFLDETEVEDIPAVAKVPVSNGEPISAEQKATLEALIKETGANEQRFLDYIGAASLAELPANRFSAATAALARKKEQIK